MLDTMLDSPYLRATYNIFYCIYLGADVNDLKHNYADVEIDVRLEIFLCEPWKTFLFCFPIICNIF